MPAHSTPGKQVDKQIGFVGAGQMARALARGFLDAGLVQAGQITVHDPFPAATDQFVERVGPADVVDGNAAVVERSDVVVLAVKPQFMQAAVEQLRPAVLPSKLFVSIAAGIPLGTLCEWLGTQRVIRVMPNTPCLVGAGASGFALAAGAAVEDGDLVGRLLNAVGVAFPLDEHLLDAVTGLSGSGPAYAFAIIEALSDGGVRMGLPRVTATTLAAQTLFGAARMVLEQGEHPAVLKDRVTSPGGTTIAGLQALEDRGARAAMMAAVQAATRRAQELGGNG